jgi:hypothetical protein
VSLPALGWLATVAWSQDVLHNRVADLTVDLDAELSSPDQADVQHDRKILRR